MGKSDGDPFFVALPKEEKKEAAATRRTREDEGEEKRRRNTSFLAGMMVRTSERLLPFSPDGRDSDLATETIDI